jgi:hypothetical protein
MRRRGKQKQYTEPVSLAAAMQREDHAAWPNMVAEHASYLIVLATGAANDMAADPGDELGSAEIGLPLLMFAAELAAVVEADEHRDQLPADLVASCERTVAMATLAAAECLSGLTDAVRDLPSLAS